MVPYEDCIVSNPHYRDDYRQKLIVRWPDGRKTSVQYHRYLLEVKLGRYLDRKEVAHHIDGNCANNSLDNLEALPIGDHVRLHQTKEAQSFVCPWCSKVFKIEGKELAGALYKRSTRSWYKGPFCCTNHAYKMRGK